MNSSGNLCNKRSFAALANPIGGECPWAIVGRKPSLEFEDEMGSALGK